MHREECSNQESCAHPCLLNAVGIGIFYPDKFKTSLFDLSPANGIDLVMFPNTCLQHCPFVHAVADAEHNHV